MFKLVIKGRQPLYFETLEEAKSKQALYNTLKSTLYALTSKGYVKID